MNMPTATARNGHASPCAKTRLRARGAHAKPDSDRRPAGLPLALVWSLAPAMLGLVARNLQAGNPGWALLIFIAHQALAWTLTFRRDLPIVPSRRDWLAVAAASALTIAVCAPTALGWLLLPVVPALLLHSACRHGHPPCVRAVMRIFSVAALAAVIAQLAGVRPAPGVIIAVAGATLTGLVAIEILIVPALNRPTARSRIRAKSAAEEKR